MMKWLREKLPFKAKVIIAVLVLALMAGGGVVAFKFYDFTQNNPKFCVSCHLMKPAFDAWATSEHAGINCHDCHHLTIPEQNQLLITFVLHRPTSVPERHGKIIVPWKYCIKCHWEREEKFENAPLINKSPMHAKHYFMEQIECSKCHGYIVHRFTPEERFCVKCHQGKTVHGGEMANIACLNCHTDRTVDLKPGSKKCLYCHGNDEVRKELVADATTDVKHYAPDPKIVKKAVKIDRPANAPMQFFCYNCHKPHEKARPDWADCFKCHGRITDVGKHETHIKVMGMGCKDCHKPHSWRVTPESAKKLCTTCHDYKKPEAFL